ncbi:MAG TPA: 4Fe-4S dicluster domain-containing protein [Burkholderiales bacterium]|jgi:4Fe-4S ferredoxin
MSAEPDCKQEPGVFMPVIDRNRCEGKEACVKACPYDVFTMGTVLPEQRKGLSLRGKLKGYAHRWQQAFATNADACHACGLCVAACPEKAITLTRA